MAQGSPRARTDIVVEIDLGADWPPDGFGPVAHVLSQLPDPSSLPQGTSIAVPALGREPAAAGVLRRFGRALGRMAGRPRARVALAVRCTALLARGFADIGAGLDAQSNETVAWGRAR